MHCRDKEVKVLKKAAWLNAAITFMWSNVPILFALASFTTYVLMAGGQTLTAEVAFVSISYVSIIALPMAFLPYMIVGLVQVGVSLNRLNKFMNHDELEPDAVTFDEDKDNDQGKKVIDSLILQLLSGLSPILPAARADYYTITVFSNI